MKKSIRNAIEILVFALFIFGITFADLPKNILNLTIVGTIILGVNILLNERRKNEKNINGNHLRDDFN